MSNSLVIILQSQMSDQGFALKVAQGVLQRRFPGIGIDTDFTLGHQAILVIRTERL